MEAALRWSGPPRTKRRFVDAVQKIGPPPARALDGTLARETLTLVIDGVEQPVEVERQARRYGGAQGYWRCPVCDRRCCHLFVVGNAPTKRVSTLLTPVGSPVACRLCAGPLDYRSRHVLHPALIRAAKLRRKLGAAPGLLSRLPPRPPHWRSDYWARTLADLAAAERVIAELLGATLREVKRRKARLDGQ